MSNRRCLQACSGFSSDGSSDSSARHTSCIELFIRWLVVVYMVGWTVCGTLSWWMHKVEYRSICVRNTCLTLLR
jgi:hypothetical protein